MKYALTIEVEQGWLALAPVILDGTTPLPKAACKGLAPKFNVGRAGPADVDVSAAVAMCRGYSDRTPCKLWGRDAPAGTVSGVLGNVIRWPPMARANELPLWPEARFVSARCTALRKPRGNNWFS